MWAIPDHIKIDLSRCKSCTLYKSGFTNFVPPDGPVDARLIKVGEAPGLSETKQGIPFCGKAGIEDTRYSKENNIYRNNTYVTNICKCRPPENRDPTDHEIECCSYILKQELETVKSQYIACLGRIAARYFLGPDIDMETVHGIPYYTSFLPDSTYIGHRVMVPMFHPAYGLHDPRNMIFVDSDYKALGRVLYKNEIPRELGYDAGKYNTYEEIKDSTKLGIELVSMLDTKLVAIDTESENNKPWCLTICCDPGKAYLIRAENKKILNCLNTLLIDWNVTIILHHSKHDIPILESMGIQINHFEDTMIMPYLLQDIPKGLKPLADRIAQIKMTDYSDIVRPAQEGKSIAYLASILDHTWPDPDPVEILQASGKIHTKHPQNIAKKALRAIRDYQKNPDLDPWKRWHSIALDEGRKMVEDKLGPMPSATLADIPFKDALKYACRDASATLAIYPHLKQRIIDSGLEETYKRDLGIIRWLIMAESHGMRLDVEYLCNLTDYFNTTMDDIRTQIECIYAAETGQDYKFINPSSTQQTAQILYDMGLLRSKTGSTDSKTLDCIRTKHQIVDMITEYRELKKLRGTYSEALPLRADKNGIIHTSINHTQTTTGRLSSSNPNLQNIPMRTETGRKIKKAFIAPPGCVILSSDYSQIEMRVAADISQDPIMCEVYINNGDIHSKTAMEIFGLSLSEIDPMEHRYPCKHLNFSMLYDISDQGLQIKLATEGIYKSLEYCHKLRTGWLNLYSGIRRSMEMAKYYAVNKGKVWDFAGRYRLLPGARSSLSYIKNEALRQATNVPPQSSAGQIVKEAMRQLTPIYRDLSQGGRYIVQPVMQIHDDLLHYVSEEIVDTVAPIIKGVMENAIKLSIPVKVDQKVGYNWLEMKGRDK